MINLVTLTQAKLQLNIMPTNTDRDDDITMKIAQASEIVMNYYKYATVPDDWFVTSVSPVSYQIPQWAQASTLLVLSELYFNREASVADVLSNAVKSLIPRDPTLA